MSQYGNYKGSDEWLEKLTQQQEKEFLDIIDLKVENELLNNYLRNNKLPFCIIDCEMPFDVKRHSTAFTIRLVEMIKSGKLVYKDA